MTSVKICGCTRPEDALVAEAAGADAVGLIFVVGSRRELSPERARAVVADLGPFVGRVGVFADQPLDDLLRTADRVGLSAVQLHGHEDDAYAAAVARHLPVVRARRVVPGRTPEVPAVGTLLLDGPEPGSGLAFDWAALDPAPLAGKRWILAGGLTPENVGRAVARLRPWGVDVSSGVESAPGLKDPGRVRAFVAASRELSTEVAPPVENPGGSR